MRSASAAAQSRQPLDEVMLAMDVVDTLRHQEKVVARELSSDARDEELKQKLKRIYQAQGIDVSEQIIEEGVRALQEDRFSYRSPPSGFSLYLARLYVSRGSWLPWAGGLALLCVIAIFAYQLMIVKPREALPGQLQSRYEQVLEKAESEAGKNAVESIYAQADSSRRVDDAKGMQQALGALDELERNLDQSYTLQIVSRAGKRSGVWRIPDINSSARNYYIIVEAIDDSGTVQQVAITNEETGKAETVSTWGVRVDESTFRAIAADKQDDGIIQNNVFGQKKRGYLEQEYLMPTPGGFITSW
ncbi:MAG: hypothetical protein KJO60_12025 [Desulfofustis sp.]|nr:hypothetical protein [Desulfofustis sp.]MBT8355245.1 hypothetical protein [Desulfofustis sp.]NNK56718.1 hypothetical protein [Desulfofustis sp.]